MKAIDLFCGAGGMSLGAKQADIEVVCAVDYDKYAANTYKRNFNKTIVQEIDIRNFDSSSYSFVDLVFGGPPCQGFSTSNQRNRNRDNSNNWLFEEFIKVVNAIKPSWVVLENVKGIIETEQGFFLDQIITTFQSLGYQVWHKSLNAKDYGVPQCRSRVFVVASRNARPFCFPDILQNPYVTVREAIADLPKLVNGADDQILPYNDLEPSKYAKVLRRKDGVCTSHLVTKNNPIVLERYEHVPQGGNWEYIPNHLMNNYKNRFRCHTGIYRRLDWDKPSCVIGNYRKNMLIHPEQNRGLSVREAARLQSFPDWFEFTGSIGFQQQQVGNAVPPELAKFVFKEVVKAQ